MRDSIFIDVPCGLFSAREEGKDADLLPLTKKLGVKAYLEVDLTADVLRDRLPQATDILADGLYTHVKTVGEIATREEKGLDVFTIQDDVLGLLSKIVSGDDRLPITVYLSALQPDAAFCAQKRAQEDVIVPYLMALYDECSRVLCSADTLILNSSAMLTAGVDDACFPEVDATVALLQRGFSLARRCKYDKVHVYVK